MKERNVTLKKFVSLMLSLVMVLALVPSAFAAEFVSADDKFADVPDGAWYLDELNYAVYNGYISGTSSTEFSPYGILTRAQFVTILGRMMGVSSSASGVTRFTDVPSNSWYAPYVAWAASEGYVNGTSQTTFAPESKLTVEQLGTVLANYLNKSGKTVSGAVSVLYTDFSEVSGWAKDNMTLMQQYNLLVADKNGHVFPQKQVTRAEAVVSLVRLARGIGMGTEPVTTKPVEEPKLEVASKELLVTVHGAEAYNKAVEIRNGLWASGKITSTMTEKEKAIVYFEWMCMNCRYSTDSVYEHRDYAYGALIEGVGECDGLSNAYHLLLNIEGIKCKVASSYSEGSYYGHAWNEAVLDGKEYKIDLGNAVGACKNQDGSYSSRQIEFWRDKYFMDRQEWLDKYYGTPMDD